MHVKSQLIKIGGLFLLLALLLAACASPGAVSPPEPVAVTAAPATPAPVEPTPTTAEATTRPIEIADVQVEIGVGSPIPVEVVASGTWPDLCAQLAQVRQQVSENRFEIEILAGPADATCPPDNLGLPFRVPLNMAEMPLGAYTVAVNGVETVFEWTGAPSVGLPIENLGLTFAYLGWDGNLWIADASGGPPRQITSDAAGMESSGDVISYYFPKISPDGRYIAARRDAGTPVTNGMQYTFGLMVYDTETGEGRAVYEDADSPPAGFDWKPGTHLLAYGLGADPNYFTARGEVDAALATGIFAADLDTGETSVLVAPEKGYVLMLPTWSPDGRFLSFDELIYMEGRGPFAYYDFETGEYIAWDEALGQYDWSPDGSQLVYDRLTYSPQGTERIFTRARLGGEQVQVSPDLEQGYAYYPVYSPDGTMVAYAINPSSVDNPQHKLVVQDLGSGEVRELDDVVNFWGLEWSSDGKVLVYNNGPHESATVYGYVLESGESIPLAEGREVTLARP